MLWRQVRAKVLARRGEHAEAERLARDAVAMGDETESLNGREMRTPISRRCCCSPAGATKRSPRSRQALERYERKGNLVSAQRARARLAELRDP